MPPTSGLMRAAVPGWLAATVPTFLQTRMLEALPGVLSWVVILTPIWLTLIDSALTTLLLGAVIGVFFFRASPYGLLALVNRRRIVQGMEIDWLSRLTQRPDWQQHRIILMIRAYREGNREMLSQTLSAIYGSSWKLDGKLMSGVEVVFATEANDPVTPPLVEDLADEFAGRLVVRQIVHPPEPNVLPGPSSAMHYVGRVLYREALQRNEDPSRILVVDLDSDTIVHPGVFSLPAIPLPRRYPTRSARLPAHGPLHLGLLEGTTAQPAGGHQHLGSHPGLEPKAGDRLYRRRGQPRSPAECGFLAHSVAQPGQRHRSEAADAVRLGVSGGGAATASKGIPGDGGTLRQRRLRQAAVLP